MKAHFILLAALFVPIIGTSQTATSIKNGNWTNTGTWDCNCVPSSGYAVTIKHKITLNTNLLYTSGGITINSNASLSDNGSGKDIWIKGGSFANYGSVSARLLNTQLGSFSNEGSITALTYVNSINYFTSGTFQNIDSITNNAIITNNGNFLNIGNIINVGNFTNNGKSVYNQFTNKGNYTNNNNLTFSDITNSGTFNNSDSTTGLKSLRNQAKINNSEKGYILLNNSLLNQNTNTGTAVINNNGLIKIMDSFYNYDTIKGSTGRITVQDSSVNYGYMNGSFNFCDLTPPSSAPFIDYNYGRVSANITWCMTTEINEVDKTIFIVYPNPASSVLNFQIEDQREYEIKIFKSDGSFVSNFYNTSSIDISSFTAGLYFISFSFEDKLIVRKFQVVK